MKRLNNKKFLLLLSFLVTIIIAFVPGIGIRVEEPSYYFGFPAEFWDTMEMDCLVIHY